MFSPPGLLRLHSGNRIIVIEKKRRPAESIDWGVPPNTHMKGMKGEGYVVLVLRRNGRTRREALISRGACTLTKCLVLLARRICLKRSWPKALLISAGALALPP